MSDRTSAPLIRIAYISALTMILEMMLVRWVGTELRVFAYLQNGVLIAAFLGLGLGCRNARSPVRLLPATLALCAVALVIRDPWRWDIGEAVTQGLIGFQDSAVWFRLVGVSQSTRTALAAFSLMMSLGLLAAIAYAFRPLGQWLGAWMDAHPRPILAYTANILGSLLGIAVFVAATAAQTTPFVWLAATGLGVAACAIWADDGRPARAVAIGLALGLPLFAWGPAANTTWSPYQKLTLFPLTQTLAGGRQQQCGEIIAVNNAAYQTIVDLDPGHMAAHPELYPPGEIRGSHYVLPYELVGSRAEVLVVGAGAGNDVAAALRAGASHVDAVEIDPAIVDLGRARHPNRPYSSARVTVHIDDARAFFGRARGPYDLVWFGLLDSHTAPSAYANVRLDNFVYTRESFAAVKRLLGPSGVVVLLFAPHTDWISDRLVRLLTETFDQRPLAFSASSSGPCLGWGGMLLVGGSPQAVAAVRGRAEADALLHARLLDASGFPLAARATSDDWPYLYLPAPGVPRYHELVAMACLAIGLMLRRSLFKPGEPVSAPMLLLGAGFMLLEVMGVSRAALLFGTTWQVNAYVVAAIFAMILVANLVAARCAVRITRWAALGLLAAILAVASIPAAGLGTLPLAARVVVGGGFLVLPVFFSGLVFVSAWSRAERKDLALGSNILGSLLGGIASMLSMLVGFRALILLTFAVYLAAILLLRKEQPTS